MTPCDGPRVGEQINYEDVVSGRVQIIASTREIREPIEEVMGDGVGVRMMFQLTPGHLGAGGDEHLLPDLKALRRPRAT